MYRLYWAPSSGAFVVQAALEQSGAPYEKITVSLRDGAHKRPDFLAINPLGQIPALALPDGQIMTESAAMLLHLDDAYPDSGLLPPTADPARAKALRWLIFLACNIYGENLRYNSPARYTADEEATPALRRNAAERLERYWALLDQALDPGPFLLAGSPSIVDVYYAMMTDWGLAREAIFARCPRVARAFEEVSRQPAVARIAAENELV